MANYNSFAYECARRNASVQLDDAGTEWINEFESGIDLDIGDQVRVLGSFVNEASTGETIEIDSDNNEANVTFSPYIKGTTFSTSDASDDLMKLGDYASIAYSTDSFGIEPPQAPLWYHNGDVTSETPIPEALAMGGATPGHPTYVDDLNQFYFSRSTMEWNDDPHTTGTTDLVINGTEILKQCIQWRQQNQASNTWGTNLITSQQNVNLNPPGVGPKPNKQEGNYERFLSSHIPNDFYISTLCKKLILPVFHQLTTGTGTGAYTSVREYDDLIYDPPTTGAGCLSGIPKPGYMIATIDIGDTSGWYDDTGQAWNEIRNPSVVIGGPQPAAPFFGRPNLKSGVQSVVGKLLAVRPIIHQTSDTYNNKTGAHPEELHFNAFEVYVYDFFNPGLKNKILTTQGTIGQFQKANTINDVNAFIINNPPAIPDMNTNILNLRKQVHGAGEFDTGYAYNPAFNHINGPASAPVSGFEFDMVGHGNTGDFISSDNMPGQYDARPAFHTMSNGGVNDLGQFNPPGYQNLVQQGEKMYSQGADTTEENLSQYDYGYGKDMGLSFLWSGGSCGSMRYAPGTALKAHGTPTTMGGNTQYLSNTLSEMGMDAGQLTHGLRVFTSTNVLTNTRFNTFWNIGGLICCKPETMMDVIDGKLDVLPGVGGKNPRVWFPWTYQMGESNYSERHYKNNNYNTDQAGFSMTYGSNPDEAGQSLRLTTPENRFNCGFVGIPWNINWRQQYLAGRVCNQTRGDTLAAMGNTIPNAKADFMPRYISTNTGLGPPTHLGTDNAGGGPYVWGGYNNSNTSIYFQTPNCGDTELCLNSHVVVIESTTVVAIAGTVVDFANYAFATNEIEKGDRVFTQLPNGLGCWCEVSVDPVDDGSGGTRITFNIGAITQLNIGTKYMFTNKGNYIGAGTDAVPWSSDMLMIKEYVMKVGVKPGFYTPQLLADSINDTLHQSTIDYSISQGTFNTVTNNYDVPSNVSLVEQASASVPTVINSNLCQTTIPDISYGLLPVTTENAAKLGQTASTKELTNSILTYDSYNPDTGQVKFYYWWDIPTVTNADTKVFQVNQSDSTNGFTSACGKHSKFYSIPYLDKEHHIKGDDFQLHLIRLKGGGLRKDDFDSTATPPVWENKKLKFCGWETLRDASYGFQNSNYGGGGSAFFADSMSAYWWKTRYVRNLFPNGGSCRIFSGANNPTLQYNPGENRVGFSNLYTPFRPHDSENKAKTDFDVGDAVPSAIINSRKSGAITDQLCGVYLNNLAGDALTVDNWGTFPLGNVKLDIDSDTTIIQKGRSFWETLGFSNTFINTNNNDLSLVTTPYTYVDSTHTYGNTIRNVAQIDSSVNAANPIVSNCLQIAPVRQYMVQIDSDSVSGDQNPQLGSSPYYLIGSDFPGKEFYGSTTGTKLPVIGICSRNFSSIGYVFDLGGSSITYTINEKRTIKSIRTKIFTQSMGTPNNLSKFSSVIYIVVKANYIRNLNQQQQQTAVEIMQQQKSAPIENLFYTQPPANFITTPPVVIPPGYYQAGGQLIPFEDSDTELDE